MLELGTAACHVDLAPFDSSPDSLSPEATRAAVLSLARLPGLKYLRTYFELVTRTARLTLHRWFYDILTGRIEGYDERLKRFVGLAV